MDKSIAILTVTDGNIVLVKNCNPLMLCSGLVDVDPRMTFWCITIYFLLRWFGLNKGIQSSGFFSLIRSGF